MKLGPLLVLLWCGIMLVSLGAMAVHVARHRTRGLGRALLFPVGGAMSFGLISAMIGVTEGSWTARSTGLWFAVLVGLAGIALAASGVRATLRRPLRPGQCRNCGYEVADAATCPECGHAQR